MKRLFWILAVLVIPLTGMAQSQYISCSPCTQEDCLGDLDGDGGVLILSKRSDLVITVVNDPTARVSAAIKRDDGFYKYEVVVSRAKTTEPKIEVSRRGDVDRLDWVVITKKDFFRAYLVEETQKPIRMENQTAANDAILDASLAQVEFQTTIPDLIVECKELVNRGATIKTDKKKGDNSIVITLVTIPIKILEDARKRVDDAKTAHEALRSRLVDNPASTNVSNSEWEHLDSLEAAVGEAEEEFQKLTQMKVYADGTNQLPVDISGLKPRSKMVYGVLLRTIIEEKHVSQCAGFMAEGGRQFALRKYTPARQAFSNALNAPDTPFDMRASIRSTIAQCDSCIKYENLTLRALKRINELKQQDNVSQTDIIDYYGAAADFMRIIEKYNPCEYYAKNIKTLETFIENVPLAMKFTITCWIVGRVSAEEGDPFTNVELWAYYGDQTPRLNDYSSDRAFRKLVSSSSEKYKLLGTSDAKGIIDIEMSRKDLPKGFFFRPTTDSKNCAVAYKDVTDVMSQSVGEYNKRQFRQKMYIKK